MFFYALSMLSRSIYIRSDPVMSVMKPPSLSFPSTVATSPPCRKTVDSVCCVLSFDLLTAFACGNELAALYIEVCVYRCIFVCQ